VLAWTTPYQLPPFPEIKYHHYKSAILDVGFPEHFRDLTAIVECSDPPTFENTIVAYDRAGSTLERVLAVYSNQCLSESPPELQSIEMELSAPLAEHESDVVMLPGLYSRIAEVYHNRHNLGLTSEQQRLVERINLDFVRAGALFNEIDKLRYKEIMMKLATLMTQFSQNVLSDESSYLLELSVEELGGLPDDLISAAKQAAIDKNKPESYGVTLSRSLVEPFLTYSDCRSLREKAWRAWITRYNMLIIHSLTL
jgi:peptidyl-dipeptidase Dcp